MRSYIDANQHDFAVLRESGALYVDKTRQIHELLRSGSARMYTRPRRFGKSLLLSTVAALCRGEEALFAGMLAQPEPLWIHHTGMWDWERQQRPVLQLTMNRLELEPDGTAVAFSALLRDTADSWGMTGCYIHDDNPLTAWGNLLRAAARSYQPDAARSPEARAGLPLPEPGHYEFAWLPPPLAKSRPGARGGLVLLIDEYDAPILNPEPSGTSTSCRPASPAGRFLRGDQDQDAPFSPPAPDRGNALRARGSVVQAEPCDRCNGRSLLP